MVIPSTKLYITVARRSAFASSFANTQGSVSSIYLLHLLKIAKISVKASATFKSAILACTLSKAPVITAFKSSSIAASATPLSVTTPPKYLLLMEMVLFTRLPRVFAKSEFNLSTINSQVMVPSFSKGIS